MGLISLTAPLDHVGLFLRHRNGWLVSSIAHAWVYPSAFLRTVQTIIQVFHTRTFQLKKRMTPQSMETLSVKKPPRCLVLNDIRSRRGIRFACCRHCWARCSKGPEGCGVRAITFLDT